MNRNYPSGDSGFFLDFHNKVRELVDDNQFNQFSKLQNNSERISFGLELLHRFKVKFPSHSSSYIKSDEQATALKTKGNKAFTNGGFKQALGYYSQAVSCVPWRDGECELLCVLMANRSAALYHLEQYAAALNDMRHLQQLGGYPKELHYKVFDREARCLLANKQHLAARDAFRKTLVALDDANIPSQKRIKWQSDVQLMMKMMEAGTGKLKNARPPHSESTQLVLSGARNRLFPSACVALQIEYAGPVEGRLVRAASQIHPGDTLLIEQPHAAALVAEKRHTHCWHCLSKLVVLYPCPTCSEVAFCCPTCQKTALQGHHKIECGFLPSLWTSGSSITCLLALRIISRSPLQTFKDLRSKLEFFDKPENNLSEISSDDKNGYMALYRLVTHENTRTTSDLFHRTLMAIFLLRGLQAGGYFNPEMSEIDPAVGSSEDKVFIGSLLLHNLQVAQFNAHEVSELVVSQSGVQENNLDGATAGTSVFIGGAIYPTLAFFNHSCNPGIVRYFVGGSRVVVRAIRSIAPDEQVCENYGMLYTREPRDVRRQKLHEQYWFDCQCEACVGNWPQFENLPDMKQNTFRLRCSKCGSAIRIAVSEENPQLVVVCSVCATKNSVLAALAGLADTERKLQVADARFHAEENPAALMSYLEVLKILEKFLAYPPVKDYVLCQQQIRKCMLRLGNMSTE